MSAMRDAMRSQPEQLARLLSDAGPAEASASRLAGRRVVLIGVGSSWHAAHHGAWMLREAGVDVAAAHAADLAPYERPVDARDGVIVLSHTGGTGYSMQMLERARKAGAAAVYISGIGNGGDLETVAPEVSYAYTASHTGALLRLAQIATALGAELGRLDAVPDRVAAVLDLPGELIGIPDRPRRADRRGTERVDGAGGRAEDPRGLLYRRRGALVGAVLPRTERRPR
jgi:glutamine---fructose-6-phosphate transaminase (isomerizing)